MYTAQISKTDTLLQCCLQNFREVFPSLISAAGLPSLVKTGDVDWDSVDAAFCCLPHATTQASGCPSGCQRRSTKWQTAGACIASRPLQCRPQSAL